MEQSAGFRWWYKGDLDGFFGLFVDNLIQLILIVTLCGKVLGFPDGMVYGRILPGVAVSLLAGNAFYAYQAKRLMARTGQAHATALPFGVNTVSLFAYILFVMMPVVRQTHDVELAWRVGLAACLGSGLIELGGAFVAGWVKKVTPRAALLATLAGIAITFISMDFCFRIFADPLIGFAGPGGVLPPLRQQAEVVQRRPGPRRLGVLVHHLAIVRLRRVGVFRGVALAHEVQGVGRALAIRERSLGVNHPDVAVTLTLLAQLCWEQNRFSSSIISGRGSSSRRCVQTF